MRVKKKKKCSSRPTNSTGDCLLIRSQCLHRTHLEVNCTHPHPKRVDGAAGRRATLWLETITYMQTGEGQA